MGCEQSDERDVVIPQAVRSEEIHNTPSKPEEKPQEPATVEPKQTQPKPNPPPQQVQPQPAEPEQQIPIEQTRPAPAPEEKKPEPEPPVEEKKPQPPAEERQPDPVPPAEQKKQPSPSIQKPKPQPVPQPAPEVKEPEPVAPEPEPVPKVEERKPVVKGNPSAQILALINQDQTPLKFTYHELDVESLRDAAGKFNDPDFPHDVNSIGPKPYDVAVEWKRASDFLAPGFKIFEGKIEPTDIKQGRLGDCYFLSSLCSSCAQPQIIQRLTETTQINQEGCYAIWLFIDGLWKCVVIDDCFPTHSNTPIFSQNNGPELWVMLFEKAYAKVFGSYQGIESGLTGIALNSLTGAPYEFSHRDSTTPSEVEKTWAFITNHHSQGHLLTGSSQKSDRNQYLGLVSKHAYTILRAEEIEVGGGKERLLKMVNPWGRGEWSGKWSDQSDAWTPELKSQLELSEADDGQFWINIDDFVSNFGQVCACKYKPNYRSTSASIKFSDNIQNQFKAVHLKVDSATTGYISLIQQDHRHYKGDYQYSLSRLIVMKVTNRESLRMEKYVGDFLDCDRDGNLEVSLEAGEYYLLVEMDWKASLTREVVINYYGDQYVKFEEARGQVDLNILFKQVVMLHEEKSKLYSLKQGITKRSGTIAGYVYFYYSNITEYTTLNQTMVLTDRQHIAVGGMEEPDKFSVRVGPGQDRVVRLKVAKEGNSAYSYSATTSISFEESLPLSVLKEKASIQPSQSTQISANDQTYEIYFKTYKHNGGMIILYENKTEDKTFFEDITFDIENLQLQNEPLSSSNQVHVELAPGQDKVLSLRMIDPSQGSYRSSYSRAFGVK